jgi:DNA polymerase-1
MINRNILIDGNNLLHRIYYALVKDKEPLLSDSGYPTGLIFGVFHTISDWIGDISDPTRMELFLDGIPKRRLAIDSQYKFKEDPVQPGKDSCPIKLSDGFEAKNEVEVIAHLFQLLGVDLYYNKEEEADDLIASYIKRHENDVNIIISNDKDFYQLLADNPRVIIYKPGVSGDRFFDAERAEEDLFKKFKVRVPPANVRMFKALTGDPSDNIIGVPRLRKKVAAPLCSCKDVDELYETGLPGFSKTEREKALSLKERIALNFQLVKLNDDLNIEEMRNHIESNFEVADKIFKEDLNINSVYPYVFEFKSKGVFRTSFCGIADFLQDI